MLLTICALAILVLAVFAFTTKRVLVICGFYCFYALLSILDEGDVPRIGPITIYRAIYLLIAVSLLARLVQDRTLLARLRALPWASYVLCLVALLAAALYSSSPDTFVADSPASIWSRLVIASLFVLAAAHLHRPTDIQLFSLASVLVSATISLWVVWNAAQFNFAAYRGGIEVNQNNVSIFVLAGALPLVHALFTVPSRRLKVLVFVLLSAIAMASLILASRGLMTAFALGTIAMLAVKFRRRRRAIVGALLFLTAIFGLALLLPGTEGFLARFQEGDVGTLNERALLWRQAFRFFSDSRLWVMFFGNGLGSERAVLGTVTTDLFNYHNEYIRWVMDTGLVGLALLLNFLYALARRIAASRHPLKPLMVGWFVFLLTTALSSTLTEQHIFWIFLGVVVGTCALARSRVVQKVPATSLPEADPRLPGAATV